MGAKLQTLSGKVEMLTGAQIRAARGLLNISVAELASRTGLAVNTVRRAESVNGGPPISQANANLIERVLSDLGVDFIGVDQFGPGVRLKSPDPLPRRSRRRDHSSDDTT
jgi:transcriptional regulator with XRE-family HTH domain